MHKSAVPPPPHGVIENNYLFLNALHTLASHLTLNIFGAEPISLSKQSFTMSLVCKIVFIYVPTKCKEHPLQTPRRTCMYRALRDITTRAVKKSAPRQDFNSCD